MSYQENSNFVNTARKWRPQRYQDVIGQEHITTTLKNAIETQRIHHAYLFCGPRGVGKTTTARIHARAVNCLNPQNFEPCNECESCIAILENHSMDVIEIDGASNNGIDDIRKLRENAKYPPSVGKFKMYIIDEVHMLTTSAFNALLKTLEEPPPHLLFVFATTEAHKLPDTIISRCQRFEFRRMEIPTVAKQLQVIAESEKIEIDNASLLAIAKKADGSMRDSQSIFDQVIAFCGKNVKYEDLASSLNLIDEDFYFKISNSIKEKNYSEMFEISYNVINRGYDLQECVNGLIEHFRNIIVVQTTNEVKFLEASENTKSRYEEEAKRFSRTDLLRYINHLITTERDLKFAPQPKLRFEIALLQLASMDTSYEIETLLRELKTLEFDSGEQKKNSSLKSNNREIVEIKEVIKKSSEPEHETNTVLNTEINPKVAEVEAISLDPIGNVWEKFLMAKATTSNGLIVLQSCTFEFFTDNVIIHSETEFVIQKLQASKTKLMDELLNYFGRRIEVDFSFGTMAKTFEISNPIKLNTSDKDKSNLQSQSKAVNSSTREISEIETYLIENFNAVLVSEN